MIRVHLPQHLQTLAGVASEVQLELGGAVVSPRAILDALERRYPVLEGTIREHGSQKRRAFLRYFACAEDISHDSPDAPLPAPIAEGREPFIILGALSGG